MLQHDSIPWRRILTSAPVNALSVCNFSRNFVFFFLLTNEPLFLNVFGYDIAKVRVIANVRIIAKVRVTAKVRIAKVRIIAKVQIITKVRIIAKVRIILKVRII